MKSYRRKDYAAWIDDWKKTSKIERDSINGKLPMLSEMAIPLKTFLIQADGLGWQIATNWCLCKWCEMFDINNINFDHWKEELVAHLSHLNRLNIKNGIDKRKHLRKVWIINYDFNDKVTVLKIIANKFYKEHINDIKQRSIVAEEFANHIEEVIDVISCSENNTMQYVEETFRGDNMIY